jgi:sulfur transfer complex TusBCD TusB component (DsrH family)
MLSNGDFSLTGVEPKTPYSFDMVPIMAALRYNTYFKTFALRHVPRKETIPLLADVMARNTTITKVTAGMLLLKTPVAIVLLYRY